MSDMTPVTLRGRIGTDPRTGETPRGVKTLRFRLAVPQWRVTDAGGLEEKETRWYTVQLWGRLAHNANGSLGKGQPIVVIGKPSAHAWADQSGEIRSELVINAYAVGHDMSYGKSIFLSSRTNRDDGEGRQASPPAEESAQEERSSNSDGDKQPAGNRSEETTADLSHEDETVAESNKPYSEAPAETSSQGAFNALYA